MNGSALTVTDILAATTRVLEEAGYRRVERVEAPELNNPGARVFEDVYNIVAVVAYNTWEELYDSWTNAQAALVELISEHLERTDAKAWDGYLVLVTPGLLISSQQEQLIEIRYDTSRVRKLVASGVELTVLEDTKRLLAPLLPLQIEPIPEERQSVLDLLPAILASKGVPHEAGEVLVQAYQEQKPVLDALHKFRESSE